MYERISNWIKYCCDPTDPAVNKENLMQDAMIYGKLVPEPMKRLFDISGITMMHRQLTKEEIFLWPAYDTAENILTLAAGIQAVFSFKGGIRAYFVPKHTFTLACSPDVTVMLFEGHLHNGDVWKNCGMLLKNQPVAEFESIIGISFNELFENYSYLTNKYKEFREGL